MNVKNVQEKETDIFLVDFRSPRMEQQQQHQQHQHQQHQQQQHQQHQQFLRKK